MTPAEAAAVASATAHSRPRGSIRRTLLLAFLGVGVLSAGLLAALVFVSARHALAHEIEGSLVIQANGLSAELDKMMFERLQNAVTWSRLDIMQDLQVQDVDKRLSQFLTELRSGYGDVYSNLSCIDAAGRVVSSSNATLVGQQVASSKPTSTIRFADSPIGLEIRAEDAIVTMPIQGTFRQGPLGRLRLQLDWARIDDMLDDAAGTGGRMVAVLDAGGRAVAASKALRARLHVDGLALAGWRGSAVPVLRRAGAPVSGSDVIVGHAVSRGFAGFPGLGWTTLVIQPADSAFAPVRRMAIDFAEVLMLILAATVLVAIAVSRRLSAPIVALTAFVRGHGREATPHPRGASSGEVGELTGAFVRMVDDIALSQRRLVHASKLAVVGEMSAVIAHEVRTPLGILKSSAQMLRREHGLSDEGRELLGFVESETERLNRLVSAMLDTVRPRASAPVRLDLNALLRDCVAMLGGQAADRRVTIELRIASPDGSVHADREQITQVVLNILMNALQMLKAGGLIAASTSIDGDFIVIDIADDGPGIPPEDRERIFEAFFFRREGGIGLGLAIVQEIVLAHGGSIAAGASHLGGALFRIHLPLSRSDP